MGVKRKVEPGSGSLTKAVRLKSATQQKPHRITTARSIINSVGENLEVRADKT